MNLDIIICLIPKDNAGVDQDYIDWISYIVNSKFYYSVKILETDYYNLTINKK